jgi:hypothetical protein
MHELYLLSDWLDAFVQSSGFKIASALLLGASVGTLLAGISTFMEKPLGKETETPTATASPEKHQLLERLLRHRERAI